MNRGVCELQGEYHMYVAQTPHIDPLMFHLALQQNAETDAVDGAEKTAFAWYALPAQVVLPFYLLIMLIMHAVCLCNYCIVS